MEKDEIFQKLLSQKSKLIIYGNDGNECTDTHGDAFIYIYIKNNDALRERKAKNVSPTLAGFVECAFFHYDDDTHLLVLEQRVVLENSDVESKDM